MAQRRCRESGVARFLRWCRFGPAWGALHTGLWNAHGAQILWAVADIDGLRTSSKFGDWAPTRYEAGD